MAVKCIAIGSTIMGDDGIGIKIAEIIESKLSENDIEVIYGETDVNYTLNQISEGDKIFILDSTYLRIKPGSITISPIDDYEIKKSIYSQHQPNIADLLHIYKKNIQGFIIGIEADRIDFGTELSNILKNKLPEISWKVYSYIIELRGKYYA